MEFIACGIEVSAQCLELCLAHPSGDLEHRQVSNTRAGHKQVVAWLERCERPVRACMEATGVYGLDLALRLSASTGLELMVANPRAARRFAEALMTRAKTDRVDAQVLCRFAERMPFDPWQPPASESLTLRALTRRIQSLTEQCTREKNRLHAAKASRCTPTSVCRSLMRQIRALSREIDRLGQEVLRHILNYPELERRYRLLLTIPGIGRKSAAALLGELAVLPPDLDPRQWVAHAGLDPKPCESGTSLRKPRRISRTGNARLRKALYMPALVARRWSPHCRAFHQRLVDRGLRPIQAIVALMRKLLHAIHGVWKHQRPFDGERLFPSRIQNH